MSTVYIAILLIASWLSTVSSINNDNTVYPVDLSPSMQISMNIMIPKTPSNCSTILSIDQFLSIFLTQQNNIKIIIEDHFIKQHTVHLNASYTLNLTLNPPNSHYSWHSPSNIQTIPFTPHLSPLQYESPHSLTINNINAQITNILINTDDSKGYMFHSYPIQDNYNIFAVDTASTPSTTEDDYESIFGSNITKQQELIIVISVAVVVICMVLFVCVAVIHKCVPRNTEIPEKEQSYEKVDGMTPIAVSYVDETPGNHDMMNIPQIPLVNKVTDDEKEKEKNRSEGEGHPHVPTTKITTTAYGSDNDTTKFPAGYTEPEEHEESISAMNL